MTEHKFTVGGLHCGGCVNSVQSVLRGVAGVVSADVDLASGIAKVETREGFVAADAVNAVAKAGFTLKAA